MQKELSLSVFWKILMDPWVRNLCLEMVFTHLQPPSNLGLPAGAEDLSLTGACPHLPADFFQGKHFFLYGEFPGNERRMLQRYVTAFNGSVS